MTNKNKIKYFLDWQIKKYNRESINYKILIQRYCKKNKSNKSYYDFNTMSITDLSLIPFKIIILSLIKRYFSEIFITF